MWYLEFHKPVSYQGYTFYLAIFYILCGTLFFSVALCVYVAWCFKNNNFPFVWPIKMLRIVISLFFGMFYIVSLNIFLTALECAYVQWPIADKGYGGGDSGGGTAHLSLPQHANARTLAETSDYSGKVAFAQVLFNQGATPSFAASSLA